MNRAITGLVIALVVAVMPVASWATSQVASLTDDQVEYVRNNCADTQTALRTLYATDAVARVNMGQQYEAISSKLMAPMNDRVVSNKLNGTELVKTTAAFDKELDNFRKNIYSPYKDKLTEIFSMKCYDQPIEFYDRLTYILDLRTQLRTSVDKLEVLLAQYKTQLADVQKIALGGTQ